MCGFLPHAARAFSTGTHGFAGNTQYVCNSCHQGGVAPTVQLSGPTSLMSNQTALYQFTVTSNAAAQRQAGLDVAVSDGALSLDPTSVGEQVYIGEVTHTTPAGPAQTITFVFDYTAPPHGATVTMYADGNSVDGDTTSNGDLAATTTLTIDVIGPPADLLPAADLAMPDLLPPSDLASHDLAIDFMGDAAQTAPAASCACTIGERRAQPPFALLVLGVLVYSIAWPARARRRALASHNARPARSSSASGARCLRRRACK